MADREKILRFFKAGGDEELAGKLIDLADQARRNRRYMVSDFTVSYTHLTLPTN